MSFRHIWAVTRKELRYIQRDRATLFLVIFTPTLLLLLFAYAVTTDVEHVPLAVLDLDQSPTSRAFIQQITLGDDLDLHSRVRSMDEIERALLREEVDVAVVIPPGFANDLLALRGMPLQVIIDGTEPQTGGFAVDHIGRRAETFVAHLLTNQLRALGIDPEVMEPIDLRVRTWFNPNLEAKVDLIPGLVSMILGVPGMIVALTLAREREHGTLEQLLATPIGRAELIIGKMGPYVISGMVNVVITTAVAMLWFKVPFHGSFPLFLALSLLFFFALLSMGMILGVFLRTQAAAMALSFMVVFIPGFFLTGIFFPLASMPQIVRLEAMSLPGSHYAIITRGLFITGVGLEVLWPYGLALIVLGFLFTAVAAFFFRKKLA
ncbi:MAG TPA: ABC transporter permease [Anaerolineae bacterium]|nr:ABC transporter permease [Anaerolineae bacterium]